MIDVKEEKERKSKLNSKINSSQRTENSFYKKSLMNNDNSNFSGHYKTNSYSNMKDGNKRYYSKGIRKAGKGIEFSENEDLEILKLKYLEMKRDRIYMEKEVDVLENKIKVLGYEEDKAKKNIEREIKTREENLKTINEIHLQKDEVLQARIEKNLELKKNMAKLSEMKEKIRITLKNYRNVVIEKNKNFAKDYLKERETIEIIKRAQNQEFEEEKKQKALNIKVQRDKYLEKKVKEDKEKYDQMKSEILKELYSESSKKKNLESKIGTYHEKENVMKAKLIETKLIDLNSKSMIDLGGNFHN